MGPEPEKMERPVEEKIYTYCFFRSGRCAEVSRLTEENKRLKGDQIEIEFSEKDTSKLFGDMTETIARLTEENEKLKREPGINVSEVLQEICALKAELDVTVEENEKQRARIAELEKEKNRHMRRAANLETQNGELKENIKNCGDCQMEYETELKLKGNFERRISDIEKWLADWSKGALPDGAFPFKPGGE